MLDRRIRLMHLLLVLTFATFSCGGTNTNTANQTSTVANQTSTVVNQNIVANQTVAANKAIVATPSPTTEKIEKS